MVKYHVQGIYDNTVAGAKVLLATLSNVTLFMLIEYQCSVVGN